MGEFRFANPEWLHASWGVLVLGGVLIWLELRGRSLLDRFISPLMQQRLVQKPKLFRRLVAIGLFCGSLLCLVLGLMRPQWGMTVQAMTRIDSQIMICLDVSKSMLAEDVVPNRLERAKAEIDSLLGLMDSGQQVGLIAFAGRASVLCPMTTDFGFLRLILGEVSPGSIGRGGTRIGEALTKATDGFRTEGDVNRLILLITDGEDHDSFPLDAAEKAKEKGVRVVSIGFGDESGSKIAITDQATGAREFVKDRSGNEVVSRLDGETLREIALNTEGVYIPAGTGALDLQSIYDAHIESLMRGTETGEERIIRNEGFQWFAIASLVLLLLSIALRAIQSVPNRAIASAAMTGWLLYSIALPTANAQTGSQMPGSAIESTNPANSAAEEGRKNPEEPSFESADLESAVDADTDESSIREIEQPPRELYNRGIRLISSNPDRAEELLTTARNQAGVDGELRFRALYNLGWVEVTRGDRFVSDQPSEAIKHFELAAGRFREAIRLRPESDDARHNLEVIARRILELQDAIAQADSASLESELDALIESQRGHQAELQELTALMAPGKIQPGELRSTFRKLGVTQRKIISDAERLAQTAKREIDKLKSDPQSTNAAPNQAAAGMTPEQMEQMNAYRQAQVSAMMAYLDRSTQRMSKARSFTRRAQPQRAFARWSAALTESKRARDQLRNPIEVLGVLIQDATETRDLTQLMVQTSSPMVNLGTETNADESASSASGPGAAGDGALGNAPKPAWLTDEVLTDMQTSITERTAELTAILEAAVRDEEPSETAEGSSEDDQPESTTASDDTAGSLQTSDGGADEQVLENIRGGLPFVKSARTQFEAAGTAIQSSDFSQTVMQQNQAIDSLMEASEYFYDIRRMIELVLREEKMLQALCAVYGPASSSEDPLDTRTIRDLDVQAIRQALTPQALAQLLASAVEAQSKNQTRMERLSKLINNEKATLESEIAAQPGGTSVAAANAGTSGPSQAKEAEEQDPRIQRLEIAELLCAAIREDFETSEAAFQSVLKQASEVVPEEDAMVDPPEETPEGGSDSDDTDADASESDGTEENGLSEEDTDADSVDSADSESSDDAPPLTDGLPRDAVDGAVAKLEDLQRLFFSLIEHLRDTTQRQGELGDRTLGLLGDVTGQSESDEKYASRISLRQERLKETAAQIRAALAEQAQQAGQAAAQGAPSGTPAAPQANGQAGDAETLEKASLLVEEGTVAMQEALGGLAAVKTRMVSPGEAKNNASATAGTAPSTADADAPVDSIPTQPDSATNADVDSAESSDLASGSQEEDKLVQQRNEEAAEKRKSEIFDPQALAFQKLLEALQLLDDQQSNDNSQNQDQNQDQQDSDSQESEQPQPQQPESNPSRDMNSAQMLQAIRDREAERREKKNKSQAATNGGVEKDW